MWTLRAASQVYCLKFLNHDVDHKLRKLEPSTRELKYSMLHRVLKDNTFIRILTKKHTHIGSLSIFETFV